MIKRIELNVNHNEITKKTKEATNYLVTLSRAKEYLRKVTDGNVTNLSQEEVDNFLNERTGFLNGLMSATAYNLQDSYTKLMGLITEVDDGVKNLQFIKKGKVDADKIKETSTSYLRDSYVESYTKIIKMINEINELESAYVIRNTIKFTERGLEFNPTNYQSIKLMSKRG